MHIIKSNLLHPATPIQPLHYQTWLSCPHHLLLLATPPFAFVNLPSTSSKPKKKNKEKGIKYILISSTPATPIRLATKSLQNQTLLSSPQHLLLLPTPPRPQVDNCANSLETNIKLPSPSSPLRNQLVRKKM